MCHPLVKIGDVTDEEIKENVCNFVTFCLVMPLFIHACACVPQLNVRLLPAECIYI